GTRRRRQAHRARPQAPERAAGRDPASQAHRAAGLRQRPTLERGVLAGRDLPRALPGWPDRLFLLVEDRPDGRPRAAGGCRVVPAERAGIPKRWRRLRGRQHQSGLPGRSDRRERPARRLRADGRGVYRLRVAVRGDGGAR
ncbi:MAG: Uncharacterized amino acid permease, GabP family, partial [uncultured Friedmanniella sp.]